MTTIATIEARMMSTRLPGKTMLSLVNEPVLWRVVERVRRASLVDDVVVATSENPADDVIERFCQQKSVSLFRGSEEDVLGRVVAAAEAHHAHLIVALGADNPFYDPALIDELIQVYQSGGYQYVANDLELTYPEGIDARVLSLDTLKEAARKAHKLTDRSDVARYVWERPLDYPQFNLTASAELNRPEIRLTLDYPEDWVLTQAIYQSLYPANPQFTTIDILDLFDSRPELASINAHCEQASAAYIKES